MSKDQILETLGDRLIDDFDEVCREGFSTYKRIPLDIAIEHADRAIATCIYDHIMAAAERRFLDKPGIKRMMIRGLQLWLIGDHSIVRFKKMDRHGNTSNYQTRQAKDFDAGLVLPGLPAGPVRLNVGYVPDAIGSQVDRVQVARPNTRGRVRWCVAVVPQEARKSGERIWTDVSQQQLIG